MLNYARAKPIDVECGDCSAEASLWFASKLFGAFFGFPEGSDGDGDMWQQFEHCWCCFDCTCDRLDMHPDDLGESFPDPEDLE